MSHYKPYPAYRPSGVEWMTDVPKHWRVMTFKRVASICNGQDYKHVESAVGAYPVIGSGGEFARASAFMFDGESVLLGRKGTIDKPLYINGPFWAVDTMFYTKVADNAFPKFVYYCALNIPFGRYSTNTALPSMTGEDLSSHVIAAPTFEEQKVISNILDRETKRIDSLITKKTRFIELLKEKRQALITHAVTKGLDPNVKMRDSGDDWIKEIPVTWKSMKFGRIARVTEGLVDPRDEPYRSMVLIAPNHIESGTGRLIKLETAAEQNAESGKYQCRAGNVVYSKIRPALAKVVIAPCDGLCSADMYPLDCTELVETEWLFYLMLSTSFTAWAILESDRVAMPKINRESLFELGVHVPPKDEQRRVVAFISASVLKSDALLSKTQHSIDLLKERRSAFITAAVTGQIDLREPA